MSGVSAREEGERWGLQGPIEPASPQAPKQASEQPSQTGAEVPPAASNSAPEQPSKTDAKGKAKKAPEDRAPRRTPEQLLEDEQKRWAEDEKRREEIAASRAEKARKLKATAEKRAKKKAEREAAKTRHRDKRAKAAAETERRRNDQRNRLSGTFFEVLIGELADSKNPADPFLAQRLANRFDAWLKRDDDRGLFGLPKRTELSLEERGLPPEEKPTGGGTSDA